MVGLVDEDDPASVALFIDALAPRTAHLVAVGKRSSVATGEAQEAGEERPAPRARVLI